MPFPARIHPLYALALTLLAGAAPGPAQDPGTPRNEAGVTEAAETPGTAELIELGRFDEAAADLNELRAQWEEEVERNPSAENNSQLARVLIWLGAVENGRANFDKAIRILEQAAYLFIDSGGPPALRGSALDGLGRALKRAGRYDEAEIALEEAIAMRESVDADDRDRWVNVSRTHLALLYLTMGRYQEAGRILHEVLEDTPAESTAQQAMVRSYLGRYYHTIRSYARAREFSEQALEFAEEAWGRDHPNTIMILDQFGLTLLRQGDIPLARAAMEEAAASAAAQATNRNGSLRYATVLNNFGNLLILEGDVAGARSRFEAALDPLRRFLGGDHPALAPTWNNLAYSYQAQGEPELAAEYFAKVRDNYLRHVGPHHQRTVEAMTNLALTSHLAGLDGAHEQIAEAVRAHERVFLRLVSFGSERQRLNYLQRADPLSLPCTAGEDPELIANTLLRTKGRLLDALLAEDTGASDADLKMEWRETQQRLDQLLLSGAHPDGADSTRLRARIAALEARIEAARPVAADSRESTWPDVQAALLPNSAFVDFVRFTRFSESGEDPDAYGAIVILPEGPPRWIPLGLEDSLQNWLGVMRDRLDYRAGQITGAAPRDPPALRLEPALRTLHDEFFAPVAAALPDETTLLCLCPDGSLNFLSFAVLLDEGGRFLAHRFDTGVYVSSGRDLLAAKSAPGLDAAPWSVFAVSDFAPPAGEVAAPPLSRFEEQLFTFLAGLGPIAGARKEVAMLRRFLPEGSHLYEGDAASEETLRSLEAPPAVLHLVTHGFFLPDAGEPLAHLEDFDEAPTRLYRSGIVLHGAKRGHPASGEAHDDILFASDVAGLPLDGTRLVTLSSCESALGEALAGEGVLGLRRGFALAGAENFLLTLWPVSDASTPAFMKRFYQLAVATDNLGQAVWQTQREALDAVDLQDDAGLEEAVLRSGPFVLCQRAALTPVATALPPPGPELRMLWLVLGAAALGVWMVILVFAKAVRR
ncbi:MAG: CHAT domain-containing protein [Akkermansiaceae bacterium]|nr:CHAT domain-containing protein [Akkermansiaceae bacterium]NNM28252.1 CHAT domain-containing protein [Akkermansiaceae bacterium]